jgi:hypothetical protein
LKGVSFCEVRLTIFPPQQNPRTPQVLMELRCDSISFRTFGRRSTVFGGAALVCKSRQNVAIDGQISIWKTYAEELAELCLLLLVVRRVLYGMLVPRFRVH